ncbi:MAG: hypothetical protein ACJA2S_002819 [Cyclobacteriaceae bacterium]|jgi:hypothetical protein
MIIGFGIIAASIGAIFTKPISTPFLLIIGLIMVTTHYRLKIDFKSCQFYEYLWFFGFKNGKHYSYERTEHIYIKEAKNKFTYVSKYADDMTAIGQPRHGKEYVFKAYIKFEGQDELAYLGSSSRYKSIIIKSKRIADLLKIPIKEDQDFSKVS